MLPNYKTKKYQSMKQSIVNRIHIKIPILLIALFISFDSLPLIENRFFNRLPLSSLIFLFLFLVFSLLCFVRALLLDILASSVIFKLIHEEVEVFFLFFVFGFLVFNLLVKLFFYLLLPSSYLLILPLYLFCLLLKLVYLPIVLSIEYSIHFFQHLLLLLAC